MKTMKKKFLVLYKAPVAEFAKAMANSDAEQMKEGMAEWATWMEKNKSALSDWGAPVGKTKQVTPSGVTDIKNDIGGYSIVEADSHAAAAELMMSSPHFKGMDKATVEVMEIMEMPKM